MDSTARLSAALIAWTGWGSHSSPSRDATRVVARFGEDAARELLPRLLELEKDFYSSDAVHVSPDLKAMGDRAAAHFRARHPELSEEAVKALTWCYTYDCK